MPSQTHNAGPLRFAPFPKKKQPTSTRMLEHLPHRTTWGKRQSNWRRQYYKPKKPDPLCNWNEPAGHWPTITHANDLCTAQRRTLQMDEIAQLTSATEPTMNAKEKTLLARCPGAARKLYALLKQAMPQR